MYETYKPKDILLTAEHLDTDVEITIPSKPKQKIYVNGGNYLIKTSDGKIYPAKKELFEYLFEKVEEIHEI